MNIQLSGTEEFIDGKSTGSLGQVLIRYAHTSIKARYSSSTVADIRLSHWGAVTNQSSSHRCNNVLWISAAKGVEMNGASDVKMEG